MNKIFDFENFEKSYLNKFAIKFNKKIVFYIIISCIFVISIIIESLIIRIPSQYKFIIITITALLYVIVFFIKCYIDSKLKFKEFFNYILSNEEKISDKKFLLDTLEEYKIREIYKLEQISQHYKYIFSQKAKKTLLEKFVSGVGIITTIISFISINENGSIVNIVEFQNKLNIFSFLTLILFMIIFYYGIFKTIIILIKYRCIERERYLKEIPILLDEIIINYNRYFHKR